MKQDEEKRVNAIEMQKLPKTIKINEKEYFIDNILLKTDNFTMYKVSDSLKREFALKKVIKISKSEFVNSILLLKGKPCIATVFDYESTPDSVNVIMELGTPIDPMNIPKNLIKRRMRQILTSVASVSSAQLHFSKLTLSDFVETNGGIRLMNFESTLYKEKSVSEKTFAPITHILKELIEGRRITMESSLYRDLTKIIAKAEETDVSQLDHFLNNELFRDNAKVTINRSNRASTPDPHNLRVMRKVKIVEQKQETEEVQPASIPEEALIPKIIPKSRPKKGIVAYFGVGIFLCLTVLITLQSTLGATPTFTALALKLGWIGVAACGALAFATLTAFDDDDYIQDTIDKLKTWCIALIGFTLFVIISKVVEIRMDLYSLGIVPVLIAWVIGTLVL